MTRAFGGGLRHWIGLAVKTRASAFLAGLFVTVVLQSSTATALMTASFAGRGLMTTAMAMAVMLGADLGTSLVARVLLLDVHWMAPMATLVGVVLFMSGAGGRRRSIARALIGLGLMLLALRLISGASVPIRESEAMQGLLAALADEPLPAMLIAAVLTAVAHSSLAVVLLVTSLAANGVVGVPLALALVLGANLGGVVPPLTSTVGQRETARRVPIGNALMRVTGCLVAVPLLDPVASLLADLSVAPGYAAVDFHVAFNVVLGLVFLPLVVRVAAATRWLLPDAPVSGDPSRPLHLDESVVNVPSLAIACAVRETLRLGEIIEGMLKQAFEAIRSGDSKLMEEISRTDDVVDRLSDAIKLYLARLDNSQFDKAATERAGMVMGFAIDLEHVGDIIDRNLMELAAKKAKHGLRLSDEDFDDLKRVHRHVMQNLRLAMSVLLSEDERLARRLLQEKAELRNLAREAAERHLGRVREGQPDSIGGSGLHLDMLRDFRRINSHAASIAYPIIDRGGESKAGQEDEADASPSSRLPTAE